MKLRSRSLLFNIVATVAVCGACSTAQRMQNAVSAATAIMYNVTGTPIGTAQIWQEKSGLVHVEIASISLPGGTHGIHFHEHHPKFFHCWRALQSDGQTARAPKPEWSARG